MPESVSQFEGRKRDHIALALKNETEAAGLAGFSRLELLHEALPDINFSDVSIATQSLNQSTNTPFLVSSMTAGHGASVDLNMRLAKACAARGWWMGVGSQRRELNDSEARNEWRTVRRAAPEVNLLGNIGIAQLIVCEVDHVRALVDALEAEAMIVHLNPLQECFQPEGTPQFKGGWSKLAELVKALGPKPLVVKETGCGFSALTLKRLSEIGVAAVDVAGFGGTHWGRIEGLRAAGVDAIRAQAAETFSHWGVSTVDALIEAQSLREKGLAKFEVWASGGVRSGLDAAKALAIGADRVGFAKPILQAALESDEALNGKMETIEFELKTALFCTGNTTIDEFKTRGVWRWQQNPTKNQISDKT